MEKTGKGLADYAKLKLGMPYFYGSKMDVLTETFMAYMHKAYPGTVTDGYITKARRKNMVGKVCVDCSGLIGAYRGKNVGSAQLYSTASKRLKMADLKTFPVGTVLWRSGHVSVFCGYEGDTPYCIEAKGIDYGVVKSKVIASSWSYGLLFSDMTYNEEVVVGSAKESNPYKEPTAIVKKGTKGEGARWVQYELQEAGYSKPFIYKNVTYNGVVVDGVFGIISEAATKHFQQSSKLTVDGKVGSATIKALKAN